MTQAQAEAFAPPGRLGEFDQVRSAWEAASHRRPSLLVLRADPGLGKTHLMQQFYRFLSSTADPDDYWPATLADDRKAMTIVPAIPPRAVREIPALPWLWLAIRCRNSGTPREVQREDIAFDLIRRQLCWHLAGLYRRQRLRKVNARLAKATIATVAGFAFPGAGHVVNAIQSAVGEGLSLPEELSAVLDRYATGRQEPTESLENVLAQDRASLVAGASAAFDAISGLGPPTAAGTPVLLFVDDAQWADPTTLTVLEAIQTVAWEKGWRLLVVIACWDERPHEREAGATEPTVARLIENSPLTRTTLALHPLEVATLRTIALARLPHLGVVPADKLARRCSGDIDLLHDFLDELAQAPGWLDDATGGLAVPVERLADLPSTASDMARHRLNTIDSDVVIALAYSSVEGLEFHETIVQRLIDRDAHALRSALESADARYGITRALPHPVLALDCEFRRQVYWEVSQEAIRRIRPDDYDALLRALAQALRDVITGSTAADLTRRECGLLAGRLLELIDVLPLKGTRWTGLRARLEVDLAESRLDIGDAASAEVLARSILRRGARSAQLRMRAHRVLVEAAHMEGKVVLEQRRLASWARDAKAGGVELLLRRSTLALQRGKADQAVSYARDAAAAVAGDSTQAAVAATYLAHALWASGDPRQSIAVLARAEQACGADSVRTLTVQVDHSAALALHDLERNLQVVDHAERCVRAYREAGRLESQIVAAVNLGDGLWGAGARKRARQTLVEAHRLAVDANLPQAIDVAAICLANVLSAAGELDQALALYESGTARAKLIGHSWDELYGEIHRQLARAERGDAGGAERLIAMADRARDARYPYLEDLALAYSAMVAYIEDPAVARDALEAVAQRAERRSRAMAPGPRAHLAALRVLLTPADELDRDLTAEFLRSLGQCEGLKGRPAIAVQAIDRLRRERLLSVVQGEFALRWEARFAWYVNHPASSDTPSAEEPPMRRCDYRACEARCCYDGVYLEGDDVERIGTAMALDPEYFAHVPEEWLTTGTWNNESGKKTAIRPHTYESPDFPDHFTQTRCVFGAADGACSLQSFAEARGEHEWKYKPLGCWLHPVRVRQGPSVTLPGERDKGYADLEYPGYTLFTPCGQARADGGPWRSTFHEELSEWQARRR